LTAATILNISILLFTNIQEITMDNSALAMSCSELLELAEEYPMEMEGIFEMLIDADEDLCQES
jgi:hypothetical protein